MTYRGDSPAKKIARFLFWQDAIYAWGAIRGMASHRALAEMDQWRGTMGDNADKMAALVRDVRIDTSKIERVLVLAGEGGDVSVLLGMGVRPEAIIACDLDMGAVTACRERFPGVQVIYGDVRDVAADHRDCDFVHLDWCSTVNDRTLDDTARVLKRTHRRRDFPITFLGVGYLRGRDRWLNESRARVADDLVNDAKALYARSESFRRGVAEMGLGVDDLTVEEIGCTRSTIVELGVRSRVECIGQFNQISKRRYHSRDARSDENGSPMEYGLYVLSTLRDSLPAYIAALRLEHENASSSLDVSWASTLDVRAFALEHERVCGTRQIAQCLNVDEQTVIAWKAHATRGTYVPKFKRRRRIDAA